MSGLGQNLVDASLVHERDEPEAPGSLCQRVPHHQALFHLAELAEVLPQALLRGLPAQSPDEHFAVADSCTGLEKGGVHHPEILPVQQVRLLLHRHSIILATGSWIYL